MKKQILTALAAAGMLSFAQKSDAQCVIFSETFDNSLGVFTPANANNGTWLFTNSCAQSTVAGHSAPGSALFSGVGCQFGNGGGTVSGTLTSPAITIPSSGTYSLTFNYFLSTECGSVFQSCGYDVLSVQLSPDGINFTTVAASNVGGQLPMNGGWNSKAIDLSSLAGLTGYVRFTFNSLDGISNAFDGVYVDDVIVRKNTPPVTISGPSEFCEGSTVTLTSSLASGNVWTTGATTQSITVSSPGIYSVTATEGVGCNPSNATVILIQKPISQAVLDSDTNACVGVSFPLTAHIAGSQAGQYFWYESAGSSTVFHEGQALPSQTYNADKTWYVEFRDSIPQRTGIYYLTSNVGEPWAWNGLSNIAAMDSAFGVGNWNMVYYQTVDLNAVLADAALIYADGSDGNAVVMENFLNANLLAFETWVNSGGNLFLNAAPNEDDGMNFGFGITLSYNGSLATDNTTSNLPGHPIFNTPATTGVNFSGSSFAHATVTGAGLTKLLVDVMDTTKTVLAFKNFGNGRVMAGGMTNTSFHTPQPNANNLRSNILTYMYQPSLGALSDCPAERAEISVNVGPEVSYSQNQSVCLQAGAVTLQGGTPSGGTYSIGGNTVTELNPATTGVGAITVTYSFTDNLNCTATATSVINVVDCAGIQEAENAELISVYPNPSNGLLNIDGKGLMINRVEVLSITGQLVFSVDVNHSAAQLNLSELSKGVYVLRVNHENGSIVRRIVLK